MIRACTLRRPWGQNKEMKIVAFAVFCFSFLNLSCAESFDAEAALRAEAAASRSMTASLRELESLTGGPAADPLGWKRYLHWDEWAAPMLEGRAVSVATLENMTSQFYRDVSGLEHPAFVRVRQALERHVSLRRDTGLAGRRFIDCVAVLKRVLAGEDVDAGEMSAAVRWLSLRGQVPALLQAVRDRLQQFARNLQVAPRSDRRAA